MEIPDYYRKEFETFLDQGDEIPSVDEIKSDIN